MVPLLEHLHVSENDLDVGRKYQRQLVQMKKYFSKEIREIAENSTKRSEVEILQRQQLLLAKYDVISQFEEHLDIRPSILWFYINIAGAAILGILLNTANFDRAGEEARVRIFVAIGMFLAFISVKAVSLGYELVAMLRLEPVESLEHRDRYACNSV